MVVIEKFIYLRCLSALPLDSLDPRAFEIKDRQGKTVINVAVEHGNMHQLPWKIRNSDRSCQKEFIIVNLNPRVIKTIPEVLMDPKLWSEAPTGQSSLGSLFHIAAKRGVLDQLPQSMLSENTLTLKDERGETPLHILARTGFTGSLGRLVSGTSVPIDWLIRDSEGNTVLHSAALGRQIASIPPAFLTSENVMLLNNAGDSVVDLAFQANCLESISPELRFLCDDYSRSRLREVFKSGDSNGIPTSLLSFDSLQRLMPETSDLNSLLRIAARHGTLHIFPAEAFSEERLRELHDIGLSPLHIAAASGKANRLIRSTHQDALR